MSPSQYTRQVNDPPKPQQLLFPFRSWIQDQIRRKSLPHHGISRSQQAPLKKPPLNGPVHIKCMTMRNILATTMEAEMRALFVNWKRGAATQMAPIEMVHTQPTTPLVTDSATGDGFVNDNMRLWHSRSIDMQFYWVRDRFRQRQFLVYWVTGEHNLSDYFTKHHPTNHHWAHRSKYLVPTVDASKYACYMSPNDLQGCT